jgi:hypothetical protein
MCLNWHTYVSALPGRRRHTKSKQKKTSQYNGGTLFLDHATAYIHHHHQVSLRVGETLKTKHNFEKFASDNGVHITRYHADNAPFGARNFRADLEIQIQELSLSGVGAHHQNDITERAIQTSTKLARAILLHAILHYPQVTAQTHVLQLWPFAMDHSIHMWNNLPGKKTRRSPTELFTSTAHPNYDHLQQSHVWGRSMYVLQPELQDAKKFGKSLPRARRAMYLGVSPEHSSSVDLALNLNRGFISNQSQFVHADLFATVTSHWDDGTFDPNHWNAIIQSGQECYCDPSTHPPPLADEWLSTSEQAIQEQRRQFHRRCHHARGSYLSLRHHLPGGGGNSTKQSTSQFV